MSVDHSVQQPFPVFLGHVRDEPGVSFSMEADLFGKSTLDKEIG